MFVFIPGSIRSVNFGPAGTVSAEISVRVVTYIFEREGGKIRTKPYTIGRVGGLNRLELGQGIVCLVRPLLANFGRFLF